MSATISPWDMKPLDEWSIVGMNHFRIGGEKWLYVAMTKGDRCIVEQGKNSESQYLWNRLWHKATDIAREETDGRS